MLFNEYSGTIYIAHLHFTTQVMSPPHHALQRHKKMPFGLLLQVFGLSSQSPEAVRLCIVILVANLSSVIKNYSNTVSK